MLQLGCVPLTAAILAATAAGDSYVKLSSLVLPIGALQLFHLQMCLGLSNDHN